jgi:hypothetical protein
MGFGYANSTFAYSEKEDHAYVILPFVNKNNDTVGCILIDPTSDQLWKERDKRNSVIIKLGFDWDYRTHRNSGRDMFPNSVFSIDVMKTIPKAYEDAHLIPFRRMESFFETAFNNPVKIKKINMETEN